MDQRTGYGKANPNYGQPAEDYGNQQAQPRSNPQAAVKKEPQMSQLTKEKVEAAKAFLESINFQIDLNINLIGKYSKLKQEEQEKKENWELLQKKMDNLNLSATEQELIKRDIMHKEAERLRLK